MKNFFKLTICLLLVAQAAMGNERISLSSYDGQKWQLFPVVPGMTADVRIAKSTWQPDSYIDGIVPGTAFAAHVAAGEEEDPNYSDNIYNIDESKYNVDH